MAGRARVNQFVMSSAGYDISTVFFGFYALT
jgi:hypothetical protein